MERIQILLDPTDRQSLEQLAKGQNTSMSNVVREMLRERINQERRASLRKAGKRKYLKLRRLTFALPNGNISSI